MSYMGIEGEAGGTVAIRKGEQKGSLVIEIDTEGMAQYLFLDADDTTALKEYLKEGK